MPLSHKAQAGIPEIATWLEKLAAQASDTAGHDTLRGAAASLRREAGKPTLDDTIDLFHQASNRLWPWGTHSIVTWATPPTAGTPTNWTCTITETSTDQQVDVSHDSMLAAMRRITDHQDPASENAALTPAEVTLVANVLGAETRAQLDDALAEMFERLCLVIVQIAAFGEFRYPHLV